MIEVSDEYLICLGYVFFLKKMTYETPQPFLSIHLAYIKDIMSISYYFLPL
jgi:hypothetical protein